MKYLGMLAAVWQDYVKCQKCPFYDECRKDDFDGNCEDLIIKLVLDEVRDKLFEEDG